MAENVKIAITPGVGQEVETKEVKKVQEVEKVEVTGFDSVPEEKKEEKIIYKEEEKMNIEIPAKKVTTGGALEDILSHHNLSDCDFLISKRTLEEFISRQLKIKNEVNYINRDVRAFRTQVIQKVLSTGGVETGTTLSQGEALDLEKLFYPGANLPGNKNPISGLFEIRVPKTEIYGERKDNDLLEYSLLDDPEVLYRNPAMQKFTIKGLRKILVEDVDRGIIIHFVPTILVALAYLGIDAEEAIAKYFISCGETPENIIVHIRKDMSNIIL